MIGHDKENNITYVREDKTVFVLYTGEPLLSLEKFGGGWYLNHGDLSMFLELKNDEHMNKIIGGYLKLWRARELKDYAPRVKYYECKIRK